MNLPVVINRDFMYEMFEEEYLGHFADNYAQKIDEELEGYELMGGEHITITGYEEIGLENPLQIMCTVTVIEDEDGMYGEFIPVQFLYLTTNH